MLKLFELYSRWVPVFNAPALRPVFILDVKDVLDVL